MGEVGILRPGERVELLNGAIIQMNPIGPLHAMTVARWTRLLVESIGDDGIVWVQNPVVADPYSEPQPDLAVLRTRAEDYWGGLPRLEDTLLVIEVSDSSLTFDRRQKMRLYARSGIPQAVITDLRHNRVEAYTTPGADGYRTIQTLQREDTLAFISLPGRSVALASILRPPPAP